jgi:hypothetical protein
MMKTGTEKSANRGGTAMNTDEAGNGKAFVKARKDGGM